MLDLKKEKHKDKQKDPKGKNKDKDEEIRKMYVPFWQNLSRSTHDDQDIDILNILKKTPFFSDLTKKELKKIGLIMYERNYEPGEYLFKEGNPASAMFIIRSGTISVELKTEAGVKECYATLMSGDFTGEISLIEESTRSASAKCTSKATVLIIFRHDLYDFIQREPSLGNKILRSLAIMISKRLTETNNELLKLKRQKEELGD